MLEQLRREANQTYTENGAVTNISTYSDCLDLFAAIGAMRHRPEADIINRFVRAFTEDKTVAMKILFFARDVRGGLGERRVFRTILRWLAENAPETMRKNVAFVAEYGRYDDLLCLLGTALEKDAINCIRTQLAADREALKNGGDVSLLGKWLPSVNASNAETVKNAKILAKALGMRDAEYRKMLVALRARIRILENHLRIKDYTFDYAKQPSCAMLKYRAAFLRNDGLRYSQFLEKVNKGEVSMHTETLAPYDLVAPFIRFENWTRGHNSFFRTDASEAELHALNTTWAALPDYCDGKNTLAVVDTSGSMFSGGNPMPASVALSLGLYFGERNTGVFRDHFISFSSTPQLIKIKGETFADRLRYISSFCEVANTNIEAVFRLILTAAVRGNVAQSELPDRILILSDMEFDQCAENASLSNFESAKRMFAAHGYKLPELVFWNVASRNRQQPVTKDEQGVVLVSGCTPRIFSMLAGDHLSPLTFLMDTIKSERYAPIVA